MERQNTDSVPWKLAAVGLHSPAKLRIFTHNTDHTTTSVNVLEVQFSYFLFTLYSSTNLTLFNTQLLHAYHCA